MCPVLRGSPQSLSAPEKSQRNCNQTVWKLSFFAFDCSFLFIFRNLSVWSKSEGGRDIRKEIFHLLYINRVSHILWIVRQTSNIIYKFIITGYAGQAYPNDYADHRQYGFHWWKKEKVYWQANIEDTCAIADIQYLIQIFRYIPQKPWGIYVDDRYQGIILIPDIIKKRSFIWYPCNKQSHCHDLFHGNNCSNWFLHDPHMQVFHCSEEKVLE